MKQLCKKMNIEKIQTSAYHPETNGCLEGWHRILTPMISKCIKSKKDWVDQVKYALFAYRSAPHINTAFTPFELIYGMNLRGPLELLADCWETEEKRMMVVCEWVNALQERLEIVREIARD